MADFHPQAKDWLDRNRLGEQKIGNTYYGNGLVLLTAPVDVDGNESNDPVKLRAIHTKVVSTPRMPTDVHVLLRHEGNCIRWNRKTDQDGLHTEIKGSIGMRSRGAGFFAELNQTAPFDVNNNGIATTIAIPIGSNPIQSDARSIFHVSPPESESTIVRVESAIIDQEHRADFNKNQPIMHRKKKSQRTQKLTAVDTVILTVLPEEYEQVIHGLDQHWPEKGTIKDPNLYGWELGEINSGDNSGVYKVVVGLIGHAGELSSQNTVFASVRRWVTKDILLVGIAGGLDHSKLRLGDVVISTIIHGYEYGKIHKKFIPRDDLTYPVSEGLVRQAQAFLAKYPNWHKEIKLQSPIEGITPKTQFGPVASGDKVIDNQANHFFAQVLAKWPRALAVEMEGIGAAHAIHALTDTGKAVRFLMVRGISDLPSLLIDSKTNLQTDQRDLWKQYASASAARFAIEFVRYCWPTPP